MTVGAGARYGLWFLLGLAAPLGQVPADRWLDLTGLGLALGLITLGLLSSTLHLGHPERAWRALSQWRSSWLSREGAAAVLGTLGIAIERWLFFAEARHSVTLYYGQREV